ncbi:MAG: hypothetical protein LIO68_00050 [Rikenellaceae bacterium]|nr:hypothetical protein [Rikenellaceae bacterium]
MQININLMKNYTQLALAACAVLAIGFTGCTKEEGGTHPDNYGNKTVLFTLKHEGSGSRAVATHVGKNEPVTISDACIFFVDPACKITRRIELIAGTDACDPAAKTLGMTAAEGGAAITGLPAYISWVPKEVYYELD